jgi:hypothetical protein
MNPMRFILLCLAGWVNREQQAVIEYLLEEIRVLKEIHGRKPRFNDAQRRRLAAKAKKIRYGKLKEIANIACVAKKVSRTGLRVEFKGFTGIELGDGFKESVLGLHARRLA